MECCSGRANGGEPAGAREAGGCDGAMGWILPRQVCILVGSGRYVSAVKGEYSHGSRVGCAKDASGFFAAYHKVSYERVIIIDERREE